MVNSGSSAVSIPGEIEGSLESMEQATSCSSSAEMQNEQNVTPETSSSGTENVIWIKEEPQDAEVECPASSNSDCEEWPEIINMEPEVIVDEAGVGKVFCYYCQLTCRSLYSLKKHIKRIHSDQYRGRTSDKENSKSFEVCDYGTSQENSNESLLPLSSYYEFMAEQNETGIGLSANLIRQTTSSEVMNKRYMCPYCEYSAVWSGTLKRHIMARHTNEKPFLCSFCDYRSSQNGTLKRHIMVNHTKEKPYVCPHCDHRTAEKNCMKIHIMSKHTNEKPYSCPHCEFRTTEKGRVKKHIMARHTDQKPYSCPMCDYKSARNGDLKTHIMVKHTDTKPFSCLQCGYKTAMSGNLKRHIACMHAKEKPFPCPHCEHRAGKKVNLMNHIKKIHGLLLSK